MREQIILCAYWTVYHGAFSPHSVAGSDYIPLTMNLTFSATISNQTVTIMTTNDSRVEIQEIFTLSLTSTDPAVMPQSVSRNISITDMTSEYIHSHIVMSMAIVKGTTMYTEW